MAAHLLDVNNLSVDFLGKQTEHALRAVGFALSLGQTLGVVGESGSGKSTIALALMGLLPQQGKVRSGTAHWSYQGETVDILSKDTGAQARLCGKHIALISQNPGSALNPYLKIEAQLTEHLIWHAQCTHAHARHKAIQLLEEVRIGETHNVLRAYPHQFSGGQQQRIAIAMALMTDPVLLIADEPSTALDTTVQAQILKMLKALQQERRMAMMFISHDLRVVTQVAEEVLVLKDGAVVETAPPQDILYAPSDTYTRRLVSSLPRTTARAQAQKQRISDTLLHAKNLYLSFAPLRRGLQAKQVLRNVDLDIATGEILGVVGESGAGKSTLARALLRLIPLTSGTLTFNQEDIHHLNARQMLPKRARMQMVFQNPYASLNPRHTIFETLREALRLHRIVPTAQISTRIAQLLEEVDLPADAQQRYPHQFSGGQRQRLSIARALSTEPQLLIADEPMAALDIITQAQIMVLLQRLVRTRKLSVVFISHDLSTVLSLCPQVVVMHDGRIVERGATQNIFNDPQHPFTRTLIDAIPQLPKRIQEHRQ